MALALAIHWNNIKKSQKVSSKCVHIAHIFEWSFFDIEKKKDCMVCTYYLCFMFYILFNLCNKTKNKNRSVSSNKTWRSQLSSFMVFIETICKLKSSYTPKPSFFLQKFVLLCFFRQCYVFVSIFLFFILFYFVCFVMFFWILSICDDFVFIFMCAKNKNTNYATK